MSHHRSIRHVEFHETDMAGIAHFARYFLWMEAAEHGFWREIGIPFAPAPGSPGWLWPRVACYFQYLQPVRFGDQVEVALDLINVGNTSLTFRCEIWHAGEKIASGETTCVSWDARLVADGLAAVIALSEGSPTKSATRA